MPRSVRKPDAEDAFGPSLGDGAGERAHDQRVHRLWPSYKFGVSGHRRDDRLHAARRPLGEAREHAGELRERKGEGRDAAAVGRGRNLVRGSANGLGDEPEKLDLERMIRQPIALRLPAPGPAEEEKPSVLARAVVAQARAVLRAALEVVRFGAGPPEKSPNGDELLGARLVRGAGDRQLLRRQARSEPAGAPAAASPTSARRRRGRGHPRPSRRRRLSPRRRAPDGGTPRDPLWSRIH